MQDKYLELLEELRIDCKNCSGLCCVALCFKKNDGFPFNKSAGKPCEYLMSDHGCAIHSKLSDLNMKGCLNYECFGAGQKVSKKIFNGHDWKNDPVLSKEIFEVFIKVLKVHQVMWYLIQAASISNDNYLVGILEKHILENKKITSLPYIDILNYDLDGYRAGANDAIKKSFRFNFAQSEKEYIGKDLKGQNLDGQDFSMAILIGADLEGCSLKGANFLGADMRDLKVRNTDLSKCYFLTQMQINSIQGNINTNIPFYLTRPVNWNN